MQHRICIFAVLSLYSVFCTLYSAVLLFLLFCICYFILFFINYFLFFFQSGAQQYFVPDFLFFFYPSAFLSLFLSLRIFLFLSSSSSSSSSPSHTPVSRSNVLLAMSLNGLDNPTVLEAYQTALTEAGGW